MCVHVKSLQLCPTLHNPMDCNPPGFSVQGILQARMLEWVVISFSIMYHIDAYYKFRHCMVIYFHVAVLLQ